ncbi:MAG: PAS domain S-box protein [Candidatus Bathyarchaeia archaeon]|jgi:PAS domain S-box-containing protein
MNTKNYRSKPKVTVLLNFLSEPAAMVDGKGNFLAVNDTFEEVTGLSRKELVGKSLLKLNIVTSESKAVLLENLKKRIQGAPVEPYEICFKGKLGETRLVEVKGKNVSYAGQPASLVVFHDITDRKKKTDEQIRSSEEKYKNLFENAPDVIVTVDLTGKITSVNKAVMQYGFKENEIVGSDIFKLVPIEYNQKLLTGLKNTAAGSSSQGEIEILTPNGKINAEYNSNPIWLNGKVVGYQTIMRDVTERKKAEQIIKATEEKFRNLAENSPNMIFIWQKGKVVYTNKEAEKAMGYTKEEFYSSQFNFLDLVMPENRDLVLSSFAKHTKGEDVTPYEYGLITKDRRKIVAIINTKMIHYYGEPAILGIVTDITERKKNEQTLNESEEKYRKLFEKSMDAIFVVDIESGIIVDCNNAASKLVDREKSELVGQHQSIITPKEQMDGEFARVFKQHLRDQISTLETQIIRKTGEIRDVAVRDTIIELNGKKLMQGTFRDISERKLMQHALEESEEKFRTITNSVKDAIILIDDKAEVVYWNPAAEKMFGYSNAEAIGKEIHELVVPKTMSVESREYIRIGVKQFASTGSGAFTNGNVELLGQRKDGTEFPVKLSITPIKLQGKWSAVGVVKEITERKQAEQKLREAEKRYHALFNEAPLGVLVIDPQTEKPVEFNDVAHTQLGYSREEFLKLCISDFEAKETAGETRAHVARMVREGGNEFETKHRTKNGEIRNVLVNTKAVELVGKTFLYCVFHDITEIRKVQDALMESESQYRQLVNVAQEGIWVLDNSYRTVFVNPQITEMLGFAQSELVGKSLFDFLDKKDNEQAKHFLEQNKQGVKRHFDCEFGRKDGSRVYASIAASVIYDDEGNPSGTLAMVSDITRNKVLEIKVNNYSKHLKSMVELRTAQLKDANERLVRSERLAAIGELAGMIGHDLRNPLTGIKNAAYYLKKKGQTISEAQAKEMLEIIDKAIDHSNKIINDLIDYSREMHLDLTECTPRTLLEEAMRMIQVPDRIQIVNHVLGETWFRVDADKIMRVFINLIKNAVDAMPEKGTLEITSRQTKDNVEIAFVDTGTGIPDETLPKIFSPLFTTKAQGMGFGLAICKRIIESHRGTITVKTAVNKGTTFTITLPIKPKVECGGEKTWINMPESLLSTTTKA